MTLLLLEDACQLTVNCMWRAAARFCSAVLLSMGPKSHSTDAVAKSSAPSFCRWDQKSHGTDAVAKSSREIQNLRARGRGRRSRSTHLTGSGGF